MNYPALHSACEEGDLEAVKELLAKDSLLLHSKDEVGYLPIHRAADHGTVELVKFLLDMGAGLEALDEDYHETPLFHAALGGNVDTASFLIKRGANVNLLTKEGYTPLINAILGIEKLGNSPEIVGTLLRAGADPNLRKADEWSALVWPSIAGALNLSKCCLALERTRM